VIELQLGPREWVAIALAVAIIVDVAVCHAAPPRPRRRP
jgi:preprotein translocase subunit Sec61beta